MSDQNTSDDLEQAETGGGTATADVDPLAPTTPDFAEFSGGAVTAGEVPLSLLLDLALPVSIELGRTTMTVQEILRLGRGAVVQLERLAGEPIDIYVGDRRFAEGEVVVLGEHFGVRITRIISNLIAEELG
jgi:flagellar motor switch protein FliN/FliY